MRIVADEHISPRTVTFLQSCGYDILPLSEVLPSDASDAELIEYARREKCVILTQDLDFSAIIALSKESAPSVISLRLASSRIDHVNQQLERVLPRLEQEVARGVLVSVSEEQVRIRGLPVG
jgi:predicted nuclease of predicted toxin-antitoxin system